MREGRSWASWRREQQPWWPAQSPFPNMRMMYVNGICLNACIIFFLFQVITLIPIHIFPHFTSFRWCWNTKIKSGTSSDGSVWSIGLSNFTHQYLWGAAGPSTSLLYFSPRGSYAQKNCAFFPVFFFPQRNIIPLHYLSHPRTSAAQTLSSAMQWGWKEERNGRREALRRLSFHFHLRVMTFI